MKKIKKYQIPIISILIIIGMIFSYALGKYTNTEADSTYQFQSSEIDFDGSRIGLSATNVKDAVDQIYQLYQSNTGRCPEGYRCTKINENFVKAYIYSASTCIKGTESGCVETTCYNGGVCSVGTIIDYNVKEGTTIRFHVLHDDGSTMTMQSQKNTVYSKAWYASSDNNSQGPITIMAALKSATDGWINVNNITITSSTSSFSGVSSIANSCSTYNSCSGNKYDMSTIAGTYKARLITMTEVIDSNVGKCTNIEKSCRAFMNNYLYQSNSYCGESSNLCVTDGSSNYGYWTLGAYSSNGAWFVRFTSVASNTNTAAAYYGARAVVEVSK